MSVAPDMLSQFGGVPVGSSQNFEGWWGATTFFVDFDNGTAGAQGDTMIAPTKNLGTALSNCSAGDTIYIKPRDYSSEDPQSIAPSAGEAANWTIATAKHEVSIIGTGKGAGHAAAHPTFLVGYGSETDAIISVYSPGCVIENIRSQVGSSTNGIIYSVNNSTYDGGNMTVQNCDFHDAGSAGGVFVDGTWQMSIVGNRFVNCDIGILVQSLYCVPQIFQVWNNTFTVEAGEFKADFSATGGVKRFLAYNNYHAGVQPTLGAPNKYYSFAAASTGAIQGDYFSVKDTADTNLFTLNGVVQSGNYSSEGLVITS